MPKINPPHRVLDRHPGGDQPKFSDAGKVFLNPGEAVVVIDEAKLVELSELAATREELKALKENIAKSPATHKLHCYKCGKPVSTPVPVDTIVRAVLECPECVEKETT